MTKYKFNFSPSALGVYFSSPLQFYYQYIAKEEEDTSVNPIYGLGGSIVHKCLEEYHKIKDREKINEMFLELWEERNLNNMFGFNGKPLIKMEYHHALLKGMDFIDTKYDVIESELDFLFPYKDGINKKGFADIVAYSNGVKKIVDWKTSSSLDTGIQFKTQVLFYAHLYYCKTGEIINDAIIEYLKIGESKEYKFSDEEVINFEKNVLDPIMEDIERYGFNPRNYELGDWKNPFNSHRRKCLQEKFVRDNVGAIQVYREQNKLIFKNGLDDNLKKFIDMFFSYDVEGRQFSEKYKLGLWDGTKKFLKNNTLPFSFIWKLQELIDAYNKTFNTSYWINLVDNRIMSVIENSKYNTKFKDSNLELRDYQKDAIQCALNKKFGILYLGTSAGKTLLSADLIKKVNCRTLFLVNRIELVRQTAEEFQNYLGVEVGCMVEGNLNVSEQITVASIQTLYAILKRNNEESKILKKYLSNVTCCIADETQNLKDSGIYGEVSKFLSNVEYMIGLSGSPFRNGTDTLEMNSLVGFIIYSKSTKQLEDDGWITPTKTFFLGCPQNQDKYESNEYHENYKNFIVNNRLRNETIVKIINSYKDRKKIMVLVKSIEHGELLETMIENSFFLNGSTNKNKRKLMFEKFKNDNDLIMISMVSIMGTGVNIPDLDILINASAFGSDISSLQTIGRTKRLKDGKKFGYFIDFNDEGLFQQMSNKRMKILKDYGNNVDTTLHITEWEKMEIE